MLQWQVEQVVQESSKDLMMGVQVAAYNVDLASHAEDEQVQASLQVGADVRQLIIEAVTQLQVAIPLHQNLEYGDKHMTVLSILQATAGTQKLACCAVSQTTAHICLLH